jgi:hypothetical protein
MPMRPASSSLPNFSWSHSRDYTLLECARAYSWRDYGCHGGWLADASAETRLAHLLKHLTRMPQVLGTVVHECAREAVLATKYAETRATFETVLAHISDALNLAVVGSHHRTRFERDPKRVAMLRDVWYSGRRDGAELVQAAMKARTCVRHLSEARVWEELAVCRPGWIVVANSPEAFINDSWPVYADPDLVFLPDGRRVAIVDWNTSADGDAELYCRKVLGLRFRDGEWLGRVINLTTAGDTTEISRTDLLADAERSVPLAREAFALAPTGRRHECPRCSLHALCEEDLARAEERER